MTTPPWMLVTPQQFAAGWTELRGMTPIHHSYVMLARRSNGDYIVRNPELYLLEHPTPDETKKESQR